MDAASKFKSLQANARVIKHYRSKMVKNITDSIKASFDEAYKQDEQDPSQFVENLNKWMYKDLIRIKDDVEPGLRKFGILDLGKGSVDEGRGSPDGLAS